MLRVSLSLVKTSSIKALVQPETPDPEPRLREGRIVPIYPGGRLRGSISWVSRVCARVAKSIPCTSWGEELLHHLSSDPVEC